jgi:integrase
MWATSTQYSTGLVGATTGMDVRAEHTRAIQAQIAAHSSPATANLMLAAVRGVLRACRRRGLISDDDDANAVDLKRIKGEGANAASGRSLAQQDLNRLIAACVADASPAGARDAAILALAYATGARRAELVALDLAHVLATDHGYTVTIKGKGNKTRTAYLVGTFAAVLGDWLAVRGAVAGPLFTRIQTGGPAGDQAGRLTSQAIYHLMKARGEAAGLATFSPHDLRRTCISNHLDAGTDIATVAGIVGHSSVQTTARYDRRGERAKQAAADNLHLAYTPRKKDPEGGG